MHKRARAKLYIERDKQQKAIKNAEKYAAFDNYDNLITYAHFIDALCKCQKNVGWKHSVQEYRAHSVSYIDSTICSLEQLRYPMLHNVRTKSIFERGKARCIHSIHIRDRMPQRVLCDYALTPIFRDRLIYDNGASTKDKGTEFARSRVKLMLRKAIKQFDNDFYILKYDFKSFFDSIPHDTCQKVLDKNITDKRIVDMAMSAIKAYSYDDVRRSGKPEDEISKLIDEIRDNSGVGICLGSQVSQLMALAVPNELDHFIKDQRGVKYYVRYMDDGWLAAKTKEELELLLAAMTVIVTRLGLTFNIKKTQIIKSSRGFTFLKFKYNITSTGRIIVRLGRKNPARMRRKLKAFRKKVDNGEMTLDDVYNSMQSWLGHVKQTQSYRTQQSMFALYNKLFGGYRLTRYYYKKNGGKKHVLQGDKWADFRWNRNTIRLPILSIQEPCIVSLRCA